MNYHWTCRCCGKTFDTLPFSFACSAPDNLLGVPEAEREARSKLDSDVCVIDGKDIFVRGCLEIPVIGSEDSFVWGLWVSVSQKSMSRIVELWNVPAVVDEPPIFGWLCNNIPIYPNTMSLKTNLHLRAGVLRPLIELEPTDHPLAIEQRSGISIERVAEIAAALMRH